MKATGAGVGSAFEIDPLYSQTYMIEEDGEIAVIDMGDMAHPALVHNGKLSKNLKEIKKIFITHAHADHIGHLVRLLLMRYDWSAKPEVYSAFKNVEPVELIMHKDIYESVWESLKAGLRSIEGFEAKFETYCKITLIENCNDPYLFHGWRINFVHQMHALNGFNELPCYGLVFQKEGHKSLYYTADSQHCSPSQMELFYKLYDIIIQDGELGGCNFQFQEGEQCYKDASGKYHAWPTDEMKALELGANGIFPEIWSVYKFSSKVHASYAELAAYSCTAKRLPKEIRQKMWLSHYSDLVLQGKDSFGNPIDWHAQAAKDGFAGFVSPGQVFEL